MKTKYKQWLRPLFLSLLGLLIGSPVVWGQTKIKKASNSETVHTRTQTVYVNGSRELYVPELRISDGTVQASYKWYVHWYLDLGSTGTLSEVSNFNLDKSVATERGGGIKGGWYCSDLRKAENNGYWWYEGFYNSESGEGTQNSPYLHLASCASAINYTLPPNFSGEARVICDVSNYGNYTYSESSNEFQEPYLLKRYVFVIKNVSECPSYKNVVETHTVDFPNGGCSRINFSMNSTPENYFWESGGKVIQGKYFEYSINDGSYTKFYIVRDGVQSIKDIPSLQVQQIDLSQYSSSNVSVKVRATDGKNSKNVAEYTFRPIESSGFKIEENDFVHPEKESHLYQQVGVVDFDLDGKTSIAEKDNIEIEAANNISKKPLNSEYTVYGFFNDDIKVIGNEGYTNVQNMYGLFRSANVSEISYNYSSTPGENKYLWIPNRDNVHSSSELYDRTHVENSSKSGFFYYIDASDDPGTLVDVPITGTLCASTELTVVAWVADMTRPMESSGNKPLAPNLNLILKGTKEGKEEILHQFTTGDAKTSYNSSGKNEYLMRWQQISYKVSLNDLTGYSDFHLEVQNNEPHTDGADYAIDDVRIYKTLPAIEAFQTDLCEESNGTITTYLKLRTPYKLLLRNLGLEELNEEPISTWTQASAELDNGYKHGHHPRHYHMYYTVTYEEHKDWKYLDLDYHNNPKEGNNTPEEKSGIYGTSIISANMEDMPTAIMMGTMERHQSLAWLEEENGTVYVVFDNIPIHKHKKVTVAGEVLDEYYETLELGRDYFIQIFPQAGPSSGRDTPDEPCAIATKFTVHKSLELKYGEVQLEDVTILEPGNTITGVLRYQDKQSLEWTTVPNAEFDWYYGPTDGMPAGEDITSMLKQLREDKEITTIQGLENASGGNDDIVSFFQKNKDYLKLGESSFTIPANPIYQLTVVPVITENLVDENINLCYEGRTLTFDPVLDPGDPEVDYPEPDDPDPNTPGDEPTPENPDPDPKDPEDPQPDEDPENPGRYVRSVRLMLTQIQDMLSSTDNQGTLRIPIHTRVTSVGRTFKVNPNNNAIRLVRTSDKVAHGLNHALEEKGKARIQIATLESVVIPSEKDDNKSQMKGDPAWDTDYFTIKFDGSIINGESSTNDIEFREGFWYMVEVPFIECPIDYEPPVASASTEGTDEESSVYEGSFKLTFKVVPEYVTWKGSEANMHNWNNDGPKHWRRSKNNELYFDGTTTNAEANGNHDEAYTPMRFTKVTVADNGGSAYAAYPYLYKLNPKSGDGESNTELLDMAPTGMPTDIGRATTNIEYDLVADPDYQKILWDENNKYEGENIKGNDYACVRFYGNTCDEIYFKPQSAMLHTEYLTYNKAWVDYELDPNRWYTLASPLKGIVAGDMYLPKTARQETAAFADITYNTTNYTRWDPAVYMRGWNKAGEETVVTKEGSGIQYAISGSWSNLYNKVSEPFTAGTGFSIGVKTSEEKALFRLPKADTSYKYYESTDTEQTAGGNEETLNKADADYAKLATDDLKGTSNSGISGGTVNEGSNYQLVGNPFMAHLDMDEFFGSTGGTYYILTENGIESSILGDGFSLTTNVDSDPKKVAPLQSFIVSSSTSVTFTPDMMTVPYDNTGITSGLRSATSENEQLPEIRISLEQEGKKNTAVVAYYATATEGYAPNEDALLFIDKEVGTPQIYTVAGNKMTAINVTPELKDLPLGVYSADNTPVTLNFQVSGAMGNVSLYDRETKKSYPLTGGLTITVEGNTSGRYFLRGSVATSNEIVAKKEAICYSGAPGRIDVIHSALLQQVAVYSLSGQRVRFLDNLNTPTLTLDGITPGIYVVRMEGTTGVQTEKVEVK
ncbi:MAG: T9SS type A sorting domain-containing protein [Parabacteroides sp.]|nr:T9SS type A sorting domain-containing protein [Parabacteroides sp.]